MKRGPVGLYISTLHPQVGLGSRDPVGMDMFELRPYARPNMETTRVWILPFWGGAVPAPVGRTAAERLGGFAGTLSLASLMPFETSRLAEGGSGGSRRQKWMT